MPISKNGLARSVMENKQEDQPAVEAVPIYVEPQAV